MFCNLLGLEWKLILVTFLRYKLIIYHRENGLIFKDRYKISLDTSRRYTGSTLQHYLYSIQRSEHPAFCSRLMYGRKLIAQVDRLTNSVVKEQKLVTQ
jgi:hypothetical protein